MYTQSSAIQPGLMDLLPASMRGTDTALDHAFGQLLLNGPLGVAVLDATMRVVTANMAFIRALEPSLQHQDILGRDPTTWFARPDRVMAWHAHESLMQSCRASGPIQRWRARRTGDNGATIWFTEQSWRTTLPGGGEGRLSALMVHEAPSQGGAGYDPGPSWPLARALARDAARLLEELMPQAEQTVADPQRSGTIHTLHTLLWHLQEMMEPAVGARLAVDIGSMVEGWRSDPAWQHLSLTNRAHNAGPALLDSIGLQDTIGQVAAAGSRCGGSIHVDVGIDTTAMPVLGVEISSNKPLCAPERVMAWLEGRAVRAFDNDTIQAAMNAARRYAEAHNGWIRIDNRQDGGARCLISLPLQVT